MFCSTDCHSKAAKSFHHYECPAAMLLITSLTDNIQIALRTFFKALSSFSNSTENFIEFMKNFKLTNFFESSSDEISKLSAICSLDGNDEITVNDEIFSHIFTSNEKLANIWTSHGDFVRQFLRSQISIAVRNFHEISEWPVNKIKEEEMRSMVYQKSTKPYGSAAYPFASLLNHSCAPNIHKIFINGKIIFIVQRPIDAGGQIFDNYGFSFMNMDKKIRQFEIFQQYSFTCDCEACMKNFSILPALRISDKVCFKIAKKISQELSGLNQKRARHKLKEIGNLIQKYNGNFPSLEICSLIQSFQACVEICHKPEILFE